jgi:hypothetical protein
MANATDYGYEHYKTYYALMQVPNTIFSDTNGSGRLYSCDMNGTRKTCNPQHYFQDKSKPCYYFVEFKDYKPVEFGWDYYLNLDGESKPDIKMDCLGEFGRLPNAWDQGNWYTNSTQNYTDGNGLIIHTAKFEFKQNEVSKEFVVQMATDVINALKEINDSKM